MLCGPEQRTPAIGPLQTCRWWSIQLQEIQVSPLIACVTYMLCHCMTYVFSSLCVVRHLHRFTLPGVSRSVHVNRISASFAAKTSALLHMNIPCFNMHTDDMPCAMTDASTESMYCVSCSKDSGKSTSPSGTWEMQVFALNKDYRLCAVTWLALWMVSKHEAPEWKVST